MFGKKKKFEETETLETLEGESEAAGAWEESESSDAVRYLKTEPTETKSLMDEWEEDQETAAEEEKKKRFFGKHSGKSKEKKPREKKVKEKKEKIPLTPEQKKKRRKRIIIGSVAAAFLALIILPRLFAPEILPVVTVTEASLGTVQQTVEGSGTVQSEEVKVYFSPVAATVADFHLKVGDTVEAGETLLTYDAAELDELYRQAELTGSAANYSYQDSISKDNENVAEYNRSTAALDIINRQLDEEDANLDHLNDRVREYTGYQGDSANKLASLREELAAAQAAVTALEEKNAALEAAKTALSSSTLDPASEEYKKLQDAVTVAQAEVDAATAPAQEAQAKIPDLQKSIDEEQTNYNNIVIKLDEYQGRLSDSQENKQKLETSKAEEEGIQDSTDAAILSSAARNELAANKNLSELNAQMTKDDIEEGREGIKAEFSGVVTSVSAVPGGPAAKGGELFTVASNEDVVVEMSITKYDLEKLAEGQSATITLAGHEYTGTVTSLSRIAEANTQGTPVVTAQVRIENPDENIYLGLEATVTVQGNSVTDVLVVPNECVNSGQDGSFCYVVQEDGVLVRKIVETGLSSDDYIEIKSGLEAGDKVVSGGITTGIQEGVRVTALEG